MIWFPMARRISPEARTALYYFVSFTSSGAAVAYAGIWFAQQGLSAAEIGIVNALPVLIVLGLNLVVGRLADRAGDWRQVIVAGALLSAAIPFGLFFAHGFWGILVVWTCGALPVAAIATVQVPSTAAAAMPETRILRYISMPPVQATVACLGTRLSA